MLCEYDFEKENNERKGGRGRKMGGQRKGIKGGWRERQRERKGERTRREKPVPV